MSQERQPTYRYKEFRPGRWAVVGLIALGLIAGYFQEVQAQSEGGCTLSSKDGWAGLECKNPNVKLNFYSFMIDQEVEPGEIGQCWGRIEKMGPVSVNGKNIYEVLADGNLSLCGTEEEKTASDVAGDLSAALNLGVEVGSINPVDAQEQPGLTEKISTASKDVAETSKNWVGKRVDSAIEAVGWLGEMAVKGWKYLVAGVGVIWVAATVNRQRRKRHADIRPEYTRVNGGRPITSDSDEEVQHRARDWGRAGFYEQGGRDIGNPANGYNVNPEAQRHLDELDRVQDWCAAVWQGRRDNGYARGDVSGLSEVKQLAIKVEELILQGRAHDAVPLMEKIIQLSKPGSFKY